MQVSFKLVLMFVNFEIIKGLEPEFPEARWMSAIAVKLQRHLTDQPVCG